MILGGRWLGRLLVPSHFKVWRSGPARSRVLRRLLWLTLCAVLAGAKDIPLSEQRSLAATYYLNDRLETPRGGKAQRNPASQYVLTPGVSAPVNLPARSGSTLFVGDYGFQVVIPANATRLEVRLTVQAGLDVRLYGRFDTDVDLSPAGAPISDHRSARTSSGLEVITVTASSSPPLRAGTYYLGIGVFTTNRAVTGSIVATTETGTAPGPPPPPATGGTALTSGVPAAFSLPSVTGPTLFIGDFSYRIAVPAGATQLVVRLATTTPGADVDLYVRYGMDVSLANGRPQADYRSEGLTGDETITITPASSPPLQAGTYFIAFGLFTLGRAVTGTVTATVTGPAAGPPTLQAASGNNQSGTVGTDLRDPLVVEARTAAGAPASGLTVTFAGANATVTPPSAVTDAAGRAQTRVRLGPTPGPAVVTATISGAASVTFNLTATPATPATPPPTAPAITPDGVVNGASFRSPIASGSWISIRGSNLSLLTRTWNSADFSGSRLPKSLDGVSVKVNGKDAAVAFISPTQINALAPADDAVGTVAVTVSSSLGTATATTILQRFAPALFVFDP
jgi:hypothetical protein